MTLITTENSIEKLIPENGMFLTNGETVAEGEVWLGKLDSPDNWHEITAEEKAEKEASEKRALEEELGEMNI